MEISYQHANPERGNESFVIRVDEEEGVGKRANCILVDAGDGVEAEQLLGPDDELAAILLTHAHLDHYRSLDDAHADGVPIFTSPDTAALLEDVFAEGERHYGLEDTDEVREAVHPITVWTDVLADTVSVRPIPAGHAPGACGFLVRVRDESERFHALVTGDFTLRDAAGYPGFDPDSYVDIDALFLTAATVGEPDDRRTEIVARLAERANAGSTTLCTASGLTGVHFATLLAGVRDRLDYMVPVVLAGQVAKLYDALGYEHPTVETVPEFSDPGECLEPGTVTIAGPEVPVEGSSRRLYEAVRTDGNASLVQVQSGNTTAKDAGDFAGLVESYQFSNHPTEPVLNDVVETISPTHVVVTHQSGSNLDDYKDQWDAYSWANHDTDRQILYRRGDAVAPPWVGEGVKRRVREREGQPNAAEVGDAVLQAAMTPQKFGRRESVDLKKEGINVAELKDRLRIGPTASSPPAASTSEPDTSSGQQSTDRCATDGGLYRTVGPDLPKITSVTIDSADETETASEDQLFDTVRPPLPSEPNRKAGDNGDGDDDMTDETARNDADSSHVESNGDGSSVESNTSQNDASGQKDEADASNTDSESDDEDGNETTKMQTSSDQSKQQENHDVEIEVDPVMHALAQRRISDEDMTMSTFVANAVESYLAATLRGEEPWTEDASEVGLERALSVKADPAFEQLLESTADENGHDDVSTFVLRTLFEKLDIDLSNSAIAVKEMESTMSLVNAVTENEDCPHETQMDVFRDSLRRTVLNQPDDE